MENQDTLRDIVGYICKNYPYTYTLTNARLTKMVYLADWKNSMENGMQLTDLTWYFDRHGPYVSQVIDLCKSDKAFSAVKDSEHNKWTIKLKNSSDTFNISDGTRVILDKIIEVSSKKMFHTFVKLVYSTYPIACSERFTNLNLVKFAEEYRLLKSEL